LVLLIGNEDTNTSGITGGYFNSIGAFDKSGNQWVRSVYSINGAKPSETGTIQSTTHCIIGTAAATVVQYAAHFTSMDTNGFTLTYDTTPPGAFYYAALCIKGGGYNVGSWNKTTGANGSVDTVSVTAGLTPSAVLLSTDSQVASDANRRFNTRYAIGAGDGTNNVCCGGTSQNNHTNTVTNQYNSTNALIVSNNDGEVSEAAATLGTFASGSFKATWTLNNAVAVQVCYIAMGAAGWTQTTVPGTTSASYTPAEYVSQTWTQSTVPSTLSSALTLAEEYSGIIWSQTTLPSTASTTYTPTVALLWSPTNVPGVATAVSTISFWSGKGWSQTTVPSTTSRAITPPFSLVDEDGADITNCVVEFIDWPSALEIDIVNG